jgi:hypothetical protein
MDTKLQIRCSEEQKQEWTRAAGGEGSLSEWMRATLDRQARVTIPSGYSERLDSEGGMAASGKFSETIGEGGTTTEPDPPREGSPPDPTGLDPGIPSTGQEMRSWPDYGYDDTPPEPEEPMPRIELPVPRPLAVPPPVIPPQVIEPQYTLPSPTCRNAVYHWKLTAGEACPYCGGMA